MDNEAIGIAISTAIYEDNTQEVIQLLSKNPDFVNRGLRGESWLKMAAQCKNLALATYLLGFGCDVNAEHDLRSRFTALDTAISKVDMSMVRLLLEHGANPNQGNQVIGAIVGPNPHSLEMVKLLEMHGADLHRVFTNQQTKQPMNALRTAIDWGKDDVAHYLQSKGAVLPKGNLGKADVTNSADEVVAFFSKYYGAVRPQALVEIVPSGWPPVAVHVVPASKDRNHITLFTTGMSSEPLHVPPGQAEYQFAELFIQLPSGWKYTELEDSKWGWPIHWLRSTARNPYENQTWLGPVTIISNEDPPRALSPDTKFTSLLLLAEKSFVTGKGQTILLYRVTPLYTEERDLGIENIGALLKAFDRHSVPFILQPDRPNVALLEG